MKKGRDMEMENEERVQEVGCSMAAPEYIHFTPKECSSLVKVMRE